MDIKVDNLDFDTLRLIDENGQYQQYNLKQELKINESILQQEMLEQPSKYIYWSSLLEKLRYYQELEDLKLEKIVAGLDGDARAYIKKNDGKPTKDQVDAYIKQQDEYITQRQRCIHYDHIIGRVQRIVKAFEQRKDMIQSYGKQVANDWSYGHGAGSKSEIGDYSHKVQPQVGGY
ncbi:hypothetical protein DNAM5_183 [Bacillus phage Vinny]|uniref:SsDNA binding protein n=1 Tax=Bacillus phage Vinny TaxID=1805955 RepID=A0A143FI75_9CAUD|nr:hypothetical protein DNAM5_183 [Bacillus phage Vinny]